MNLPDEPGRSWASKYSERRVQVRRVADAVILDVPGTFIATRMAAKLL